MNNFSVPVEELTYLAGFFDGEGCIQTQVTKRCLALSVTNKWYTPLEKFMNAFGGRVHLVTDKKGFSCFRWEVYADGAMLALKQLLPFLIIKKQRAKIAIEFQELKYIDPSRRKELALKITSLNKEGARREVIRELEK